MHKKPKFKPGDLLSRKDSKEILKMVLSVNKAGRSYVLCPISFGVFYDSLDLGALYVEKFYKKAG